jgi:hypothetical protein
MIMIRGNASRTAVAHGQWRGSRSCRRRPVFPPRLEAGVRLGLLSDVQWIDLVEGETAFTRLFEGVRRAGLGPAVFAWDPNPVAVTGTGRSAATMPPCSLAATMRSPGWWSCCSRLCSAALVVLSRPQWIRPEGAVLTSGGLASKCRLASDLANKEGWTHE